MSARERGMYGEVIHPRAALKGHDGGRGPTPNQRDHLNTIHWRRILDGLPKPRTQTSPRESVLSPESALNLS